MHFALGRFSTRERFSTAHAPRTRETLSRLSNQPRPLTVERVRRRGFFRFVSVASSFARSVRENASRCGRVARVARAPPHTRTRATTDLRDATFPSRRSPPRLLADMSAEEPFAPESSRRRRDPARTAWRLSARTRLAAARATRAFLVAAAAVSAGAQSLSAQGGMYYPYGSAVGPLYGYARRPRRVARARREPSSRPTRACSFAPLTRSSSKKKRETPTPLFPRVQLGPHRGRGPVRRRRPDRVHLRRQLRGGAAVLPGRLRRRRRGPRRRVPPRSSTRLARDARRDATPRRDERETNDERGVHIRQIASV
jgi:hypothetical protein